MGQPAKDFTGQRIGIITVLSRAPYTRGDKAAKWYCLCDCGKTFIRPSGSLNHSESMQSCGCIRQQIASISAKWVHRTHGHYAGHKPTPTYNSWQAMMRRCDDPNNIAFARYGGAGISVCKAWRDSFSAFLNDMGERPHGRTIDRIDNRFGYFFSNCRWSTRQEQQQNRTSKNQTVEGICR